MIKVDYPAPDFRIKKEEERSYIFDSIRKTWLLLTEEEWVRQNFVVYLVKQCNYPLSLIALEKEIMVLERRKRFDILVYNKEYVPWMIVECKAPTVQLSENTLQQALAYHISVPACFIVITNGPQTIAWEKKDGQLMILDKLPQFDETS